LYGWLLINNNNVQHFRS